MEGGENKKRVGKFIVIGLGLAVVSVGGYFLLKSLKKGSQNQNNADLMDSATTDYVPQIAPQPSYTGASQVSTSSEFPLKRGSTGTLVHKLQEGLNANFGLSIGVDGQFGPETQKALMAKGLPVTIDQLAFDKIVSKKESGSGSSGSEIITSEKAVQIVASALKIALAGGDLNKATKALSYIKSKSTYIKVNNEFKKVAPVGDFIRKTIVTALLGTFTDTGDKAQLEKEFKRIGLKKSGSSWSLSGLAGGELISVRETKVWDANGREITVPKYTILGDFINGANGVTEFETLDAKRLFTATDAIQFRSR